MLNIQIIIIIMDLILYFVPKHEESEAAEFTNQAHVISDVKHSNHHHHDGFDFVFCSKT